MRRKRAVDPDALAVQLDQPGADFEVGEAAAVLRLSRGTVHQLIKAGQLGGYKLPGVEKVLVPRQAIRDYLARARQATAAG
jgi:excisionase family DNA binding protein